MFDPTPMLFDVGPVPKILMHHSERKTLLLEWRNVISNPITLPSMPLSTVAVEVRLKENPKRPFRYCNE